jgi:hypothetical protein
VKRSAAGYHGGRSFIYGSVLSIAGLPIAFVMAFAYVMLKPRRRGRTRWRTALRVIA